MLHLGRKIFTLVVWSQCLVQQSIALRSPQTNSPGSESAPFNMEEMGRDLDKIEAEIESDVAEAPPKIRELPDATPLGHDGLPKSFHVKDHWPYLDEKMNCVPED